MTSNQSIETSVANILRALGDDPEREGLRDTPKRVAKLYREVFSGVGVDPADAIDAVFEEEHDGAVILKDVAFFSICEHHLLPFFGTAQMGYVPRGKVAGASKLVRALDVASKRPQMQERLTSQLADAICTALRPAAAVVLIEAEHLCMTMRGVKRPGSKVVTTALRGPFAGSADPKELLSLMRRG